MSTLILQTSHFPSLTCKSTLTTAKSRPTFILNLQINISIFLKSSCHPAHTKRIIPFSLALRLRRICSTDHFFNKRCYELINFLALRGYSRQPLKREVNRVRNISRNEALKPRPQNNQSARTLFVITLNQEIALIQLFLTLPLLYARI